MKRILVLSLCLVASFAAKAQVSIESITDKLKVELSEPTPLNGEEYIGIVEKIDGIIHVSEVVPVERINKADLYANCLAWLSENYKNPKEIIQSENEAAGLISIKTKIVLGEYTTWEYTMSVQIKDGRYKYDIYNIYERVRPPFEKDSKTIEESLRPVDDWRGRIMKYMGPTIESLKNRMKEESDW